MTTLLDKPLKRLITVDGMEYTVAIDPVGFRLTGKGKRNPEVELRWVDLLNGDAAMAVALNASLSTERRSTTSAVSTGRPASQAGKRARKNSKN